jgi:hypothetical protein
MSSHHLQGEHKIALISGMDRRSAASQAGEGEPAFNVVVRMKLALLDYSSAGKKARSNVRA